MIMRQQLSELMTILQAWAQASAPLSTLPQLEAFPWLLRFFINATATARS